MQTNVDDSITKLVDFANDKARNAIKSSAFHSHGACTESIGNSTTAACANTTVGYTSSDCSGGTRSLSFPYDAQTCAQVDGKYEFDRCVGGSLLNCPRSDAGASLVSYKTANGTGQCINANPCTKNADVKGPAKILQVFGDILNQRSSRIGQEERVDESQYANGMEKKPPPKRETQWTTATYPNPPPAFSTATVVNLFIVLIVLYVVMKLVRAI